MRRAVFHGNLGNFNWHGSLKTMLNWNINQSCRNLLKRELFSSHLEGRNCTNGTLHGREINFIAREFWFPSTGETGMLPARIYKWQVVCVYDREGVYTPVIQLLFECLWKCRLWFQFGINGVRVLKHRFRIGGWKITTLMVTTMSSHGQISIWYTSVVAREIL